MKKEQTKLDYIVKKKTRKRGCRGENLTPIGLKKMQTTSRKFEQRERTRTARKKMFFTIKKKLCKKKVFFLEEIVVFFFSSKKN